MPTKKTSITPEDLAALTIPFDPQLSPDGELVTYSRKHTKGNQTVTNIWGVSAAGGRSRQLTNGDKDQHARHAPDGKRIAFISYRDEERPQIRVIDRDGGESTTITDLPEGTLTFFKWSPDGQSIAFAWRGADPQRTKAAAKAREANHASEPPRIINTPWYRLDGDGYFEQRRFELRCVDVETGKITTLWKKDTLGFFTFDWSPDSRTIALTTQTSKRALFDSNTSLLLLNVRTGKTKALPGLPEGPKTDVCFSPCGKWLAWAGRAGTDGTYSTENLELFVGSASTGGAKSLSGKSDYCLMAATLGDSSEVSFSPNLKWTSDSRSLLVRIGHHGAVHTMRFARSGRGTPEAITSGAKIHDHANIVGDRMACTIESPTRPCDVHIMTTDGTNIRRLTHCNDALLRQRHIARPTSHWIKSPDGNKVQVWMLTPPNLKNVRRKPAVLQVHGGPHAQYGCSFFHEFQCQAGAGYVVVYSNPRGSKGYGRDHCASIRGAWGTTDWTDIRAVADWMMTRPEVNSKRMAIMGGSYGGYITNWAIGQTNDFACAITDRCVSNLVSMAGNSDFMDKPWHYFDGNFWSHPEARWASSPIRFAGKWKTPTLIIHSEGDLRCNVEQAEQVYAALQIRNIPSRFVRYPRSTSHGMSRGGPADLRQHRLGEILSWLGHYLKR
ncbi:MAG: S9 family peptidase [Phycisphaerales bacterium]|nr:S9 family peptidase [Phycisphaerales bacterium]